MRCAATDFCVSAATRRACAAARPSVVFCSDATVVVARACKSPSTAPPLSYRHELSTLRQRPEVVRLCLVLGRSAPQLLALEAEDGADVAAGHGAAARLRHLAQEGTLAPHGRLPRRLLFGPSRALQAVSAAESSVDMCERRELQGCRRKEAVSHLKGRKLSLEICCSRCGASTRGGGIFAAVRCGRH